MRHPTPPTSSRGFTLIELLVVMAILIILVLVALPVFSYITASRSTEAGVNLASAMIGRARALALSRSDSKYIGALFYHQPEDDRDLIQIVEVDPGEDSTTGTASAGTGLERYFGWQTSATYRPIDTAAVPPHPADVVYCQVLDRSITNGSLSGAFANRPVVKRFTAKDTNTGNGQKPPDGPDFKNARWDSSSLGNVTPVSVDGEVQQLPLGVRVRVLKRDGTNQSGSPGMILFDKQGRVTQFQWKIGTEGDGAVDGGKQLGDVMGAGGARTGKSGVGLTIFNIDDIKRSAPALDTTKEVDVAKWADINVDQFTVGTQTGELISGAQQQ